MGCSALMVPTSCRRPGSHREEENRESAYRQYKLGYFCKTIYGAVFK